MDYFWQLWGHFNNKVEAEQEVLATIIMKYIWLRRNMYVFNNKFKASFVVIEVTKIEQQKFIFAANLGMQDLSSLAREDVL